LSRSRFPGFFGPFLSCIVAILFSNVFQTFKTALFLSPFPDGRPSFVGKTRRRSVIIVESASFVKPSRLSAPTI
jgi:hypothetical protein